MLRSPTRSNNLFLVAAIFLPVSLLTPQIYANTCLENTYGVAIELLHAFYPELNNKDVLVDVEASNTRFDYEGPLLLFKIQLYSLGPSSGSQSVSTGDKNDQLTAQFQFDARDRRIFSIFMNGSFVNSGKLDAITNAVNLHSDWSDSQIGDALLAAGAQFEPDRKEALLARFPAKELEHILGKVRITSANFSFRGNTKPPFYSVTEWIVRFQVIDDGKQDDYTVALEPFEGKIVWLGRRAIN